MLTIFTGIVLFALTFTDFETLQLWFQKLNTFLSNTDPQSFILKVQRFYYWLSNFIAVVCRVRDFFTKKPSTKKPSRKRSKRRKAKRRRK